MNILEKRLKELTRKMNGALNRIPFCHVGNEQDIYVARKNGEPKKITAAELNKRVPIRTLIWPVKKMST
jgi:hypothetical protein